MSPPTPASGSATSPTSRRSSEHSVLALADGDEAQAVVLRCHYDGDRLLLRVSGRDPGTHDHDDVEGGREDALSREHDHRDAGL